MAAPVYPLERSTYGLSAATHATMPNVASARWDPLRDLLTIHEQLGQLVGSDAPGWTPAVDLYETSADFVLVAELAGMSRDQIEIRAEERRITIRGGRHSGPPVGSPGASPDEGRCEQYHRVERGHGYFSRTFALPEPIAVGAITADLKDGLLTVTMSKVASRGPRRIAVT